MFKIMSLKKSVTAIVLAVGIGLVGVTSAFGSTNAGANEIVYEDDFLFNIDIPPFEIFDPELILEEAKAAGIETEGKTIEEILEELDHMYVMEEAKAAGVETEGKTVEEILEELDNMYVMEEAKAAGIKTEGKTVEEILEELDNMYVMEEAKAA
ncbi:hypothetical protein, partial [Chengkuizengella sediminis]|uniref:hypothetical protein n=1 Tax=Chengkuizengella sediminis TaxID=1885917 RepID=UPI003B83089C|nr:hypothetical protein [Chengkuizengella sediminis]